MEELRELSAEERERYQRQISFFGEDVQRRLRARRVVVLGAGGLGSPVLYYLAAAGVGQLTICDFDAVAPSNLNRQILHDTERLGLNKAASAAQTLRKLNGNVRLELVQHRMEPEELRRVLAVHDLLIEATDCMQNKALLSGLALETGTPAVFSILVGMAGFCFLQAPGTACWRCLFDEPPQFPSGRSLPFEHYPSFGPAAGFLGAFLADVAARFLIGHDASIRDRIFYTSQLLPYKRLMISARGIKSLVTPHFRAALGRAGKSFPESDRLFDECSIDRDPGCARCSSVARAP